MKHIGTFKSARWGNVTVSRATYDGPKGPLAIVLTTEEGEPLAKLSINLYKPECSHDSKDLPPECFYAKTWEGNEELVADALASGLFKVRTDLPEGASGFVTAPVWELVK